MAEQVANAFAKQDFLVVEAGTGVENHLHI